MSKKRIFVYASLASVVLLIWMFSPKGEEDDFSERVKISLRKVGNQLLLSNKDSTSLVLPVRQLDAFKYELSFQSSLSFEPNILVTQVRENLDGAGLPNNYRVEVLQCTDGEVAYSYEVKNEAESEIIPCRTRQLPLTCYTIQVRFIGKKDSFSTQHFPLIALFIIAFLFVFDLVVQKRKQSKKPEDDVFKENEMNGQKKALGIFQFYPEQNKLVKQAVEIALSKKECELLSIFVESPNQIIKRDELTKRVWEDNGVIVGRSLDTYISKLRKKLKDDTSIKITNVHGVGYKLEVLK